MTRSPSTSLLKHGDYVAPEVALLAKSTPEESDGTASSEPHRQLDKHQAASPHPKAMGAISKVYPHAIQLRDAASSVQTRGIGITFFVLILTLLIYISADFIHDFIDEFYLKNISYFRISGYFLMTYMAIFLIPKWLLGLWRLDMFAADEQPLIFDRKHRKLYHLTTPASAFSGSWLKRVQPIEMHAAEYDWDRVEAEHRVEVVFSGQTVTRRHRLVLVVRDYPKNGESQGRLLEEIMVGNSLALGETTAPMLWEHLRQYMEENGPALQPGEVMQVAERPTTLWHSMGVVSPFGPRFLWWWQQSRGLVLFSILTFPATLPFFTLWALGNWLSHKTMRKTLWPEEVHQRIGEPVNT